MLAYSRGFPSRVALPLSLIPPRPPQPTKTSAASAKASQPALLLTTNSITVSAVRPCLDRIMGGLLNASKR